MSWQAYVDDHLLYQTEGGNQLTSAAILGQDGSVWAQSPNFLSCFLPQFSLCCDARRFANTGTLSSKILTSLPNTVLIKNIPAGIFFCEYAINDIHEVLVTEEPFPCSIHYDNEEFNEYCRLKFPCKLRYGRVTHGYSNGLICYSRVSKGRGTKIRITMYLWNPAIRKLKILPKFIQNHNDVSSMAFGFGFDSEFNDYKVLKMAFTNEASVVELYCLSTNSWKLISDCAPGSSYVVSNCRISFVKGTFYWVSCRNGDRILASLDTTNGTILERILVQRCSLRTLGDKLLVVFGLSYKYKWERYFCSDIRVYDQNWNNVLKIDGFEELDMSIDDEYLFPIGFRNNGEALFRNFKSTSLISYNMETRKAKDFGGVSDGYRWLYFVEPFVETLVLLDDGDAKGLTAGGHKLVRKTKSKTK